MDFILGEYDENSEAILEPYMVAPPIEGFPETAITCYSQKLLRAIMDGREEDVLCVLNTEEGGTPVFRIRENGREFALYMSRVGAPACAIQMEEVISRGARKFVMMGSCGVLDSSLETWKIIVPTAAVRDEGVSYHYLPPAEEIEMQPGSVELLCRVFEEWGEEYVCGKVWTTDALYRETRAKMQRRREQGCIAVDMECASAHAVAQFRGVKLAQFFYAEDNLADEVWDGRGLSGGVHREADRLFGAAAACAARL
ncbi:nucleoside phosphorylase [Bacilliculturomica massiliensis]|uniref:nucleoside phosphorylase n=1 Tax=Bacilliculturomica massiliensis TaxID=1917867 RepID=UPI0010320563|nr:nucleoside phosphorylase [Bacilliculturomica massiliensis]